MRRTATAAKVRMTTHINDIRGRLHNRRLANNQSCFDHNPANDISHVCVLFCKICFASVRRHQQVFARDFPSQPTGCRPADWSNFNTQCRMERIQRKRWGTEPCLAPRHCACGQVLASRSGVCIPSNQSHLLGRWGIPSFQSPR